MAVRKSGVGIKKMRKALSDCALDPASGWFKIVADASTDYLIRRADELLSEVLIGGDDAKLSQAIALLGIVQVRFNERLQTAGN